ncbi:MAG: response regulator transcription factor [Pirellulaceae bacterium]
MSTSDPMVLVVDDELQTRESFAALISSLGLAVETFGSGHELLQRLNTARPGCVIVDYRLGDMDGIELHRQLLQAGCTLPVILISGCLNVRAATRAMTQGMFCVLEKPYRDDELAQAVQKAIQCDHELRRQKVYRLDFAHRLETLDVRERLTLEFIVAGHPNKAVERRLNLSTRTVDRIRSSILEKMRFLSFVELAAAYGAARESEVQDTQQPDSAAQETPPATASEPLPAPPNAANLAGFDDRDDCAARAASPGLAAQYIAVAVQRLQAIEAQHELSTDAKTDLCTVRTLLTAALQKL